MKWMCVLMMLLVPVSGVCDEWTTEDIVVEVASLSALAIDYFQTLEIARNPKYYEKTNTVIGENPSESEINMYFVTYVVGHALVAYLLPNEYNFMDTKLYPRRMWQLLWFGIETNAVVNNYRIGIRF